MPAIKTLSPPPLSFTLSPSQIQCKSARAIAMETESVILASAIASQDSTAWTAPKVFAFFANVFVPSHLYNADIPAV